MDNFYRTTFAVSIAVILYSCAYSQISNNGNFNKFGVESINKLDTCKITLKLIGYLRNAKELPSKLETSYHVSDYPDVDDKSNALKYLDFIKSKFNENQEIFLKNWIDIEIEAIKNENCADKKLDIDGNICELVFNIDGHNVLFRMNMIRDEIKKLTRVHNIEKQIGGYTINMIFETIFQ